MKRIRQQGFTLLELIVSITILTLIALMLSRIFTASSRAVNQGRGQSLLDETARLMLDTMETDISQALIRTNVPFRVDQISAKDALYCISPAIRRRQETNPRDTAPVQFRSVPRQQLIQELNLRARFEYATGATEPSNTARRKLIAQSDIYQAEALELIGDADYTEALEDLNGITDHAALTFMDFRINGDSGSNRSGTDLPLATDLPRYLDVIIGLASARDVRQAMRIHSAQDASAAADYLEKRERIYTRRIFMPNSGLLRITL
ncbi:prepilin-type N-terminal cleavage/methylation domain-containing protein [Pontiellaceae bacterium B12227]|nr:prepilin-type N-terminal cleavage/methylation domain-containing protein [Pontiellaceae bacterium B12227]